MFVQPKLNSPGKNCAQCLTTVTGADTNGLSDSVRLALLVLAGGGEEADDLDSGVRAILRASDS